MLNSGAFGVRFVAGQSRVAPIKKLTTPRLELQGAVLATRLHKTISKESRLQFEKSHSVHRQYDYTSMDLQSSKKIQTIRIK